jgi:hypothetical protein
MLPEEKSFCRHEFTLRFAVLPAEMLRLAEHALRCLGHWRHLYRRPYATFYYDDVVHTLNTHGVTVSVADRLDVLDDAAAFSCKWRAIVAGPLISTTEHTWRVNFRSASAPRSMPDEWRRYINVPPTGQLVLHAVHLQNRKKYMCSLPNGLVVYMGADTGTWRSVIRRRDSVDMGHLSFDINLAPSEEHTPTRIQLAQDWLRSALSLCRNEFPHLTPTAQCKYTEYAAASP